jgi:ankyrin repeat protein
VAVRGLKRIHVQPSIIGVLLDQGGSELPSNYSSTELHLAADIGHADMTKVLLGQGADTEALDWLQHTALHIAAERGHTSIVALLLDYGARIDATGHNGVTALSCTAWYSHRHVVSLLLARGASAISSAPFAARGGSRTIMEMILYHGTDVNAFDDDGSALFYASESGDRKMLSLFLRHGADVNAISHDGTRTALSYATSFDSTEALECLFELGASSLI